MTMAIRDIARHVPAENTGPMLGEGDTTPLQGIRVLDLGTVYAAPISAMLLGDYGADVLKVEHPSGDPARTHGYSKDGIGLWWKVIARNKRTVTLNLSQNLPPSTLEPPRGNLPPGQNPGQNPNNPTPPANTPAGQAGVPAPTLAPIVQPGAVEGQDAE